jgi:hypothetical protein
MKSPRPSRMDESPPRSTAKASPGPNVDAAQVDTEALDDRHALALRPFLARVAEQRRLWHLCLPRGCLTTGTFTLMQCR